MRIPLVAGLCLWCGASASANPDEADPLLTNHLLQDTRLLSPEWVCLVIDPTEAVHDRLREDAEAQADIERARAEKESGTNDWYLDKAQQYRSAEKLIEVRQGLVEKYESLSQWQAGDRRISLLTFYPSVVAGFPAESAEFSAPEKVIRSGRAVDFVYLKLDPPLQEGESIGITHTDGLETTVSLNSAETLCWGLKVNQLGYLPGAKKFGYLGMWAGFAGSLDYSAFDGQPFEIRKFTPGSHWRVGHADGDAQFSGTIQLRSRAGDDQTREGIPLTGEVVFELDFSKFDQAGTWCLVIPGLGRSWPFRIGTDIYGEAFFHTARALFHQRGKIELSPEHTDWTRGPTRQPVYRGGYVPETDRFYDTRYAERGPDSERLGFRDVKGDPIRIRHFTMVAATATEEAIPGVAGGGWHDAADYDRRVLHYSCVWDLCGTFEMFPEKFTDGQLRIPESGNGIPDILDEAAVGVDVFMETQGPDGGVSSWIEQTSHPGAPPDEDTQPLYVSLPDRLGSLRFAAAAAYLGRLIRPFDEARSKQYIESAVRAFEYGRAPANRLADIRFTIPKNHYDSKLTGKTVTFNEAAELPLRGGNNPETLLALLQLKAAGVTAYESMMAKMDVPEPLTSGFPDAVHPFAFVTPLLADKLLIKGERTRLMQRLTREVRENGLAGQEESPYRQFWRSPDHRFFQHMGWGKVHGARQTRLALVLWRVTGDPKYREAILLGLDWQFGCNALGRTFTTGLGSVHPVVLQHHHSSADNLLEPVPGISPYTFTFGHSFQAWGNQYGIIADPHASVKSYFNPVALCLVPEHVGRTAIQAELDTIPREGNWTTTASVLLREKLGGHIPIMRRVYAHPHTDPAQNEFTVNESISPHAAVLGAMLPDAWMPPESVVKRKARTRAEELPIYHQP